MAALTKRPWFKGIKKQFYDEEDCLLATRGQKIPQGLALTINQLCVVRGIRYHPGFATELYGVRPQFTRALNARSIMSNAIPEMTEPEDFPYCIWYPETATEATYRELVARYPQMKYLVGRACAVAGYYKLFKELDLLPESHIAEEARDNKQWAIFDDIMAENVRFNAMDDYTRTVYEKPVVGYMNGDTAVRSYLEVKTKFKKPADERNFEAGRRSSYFDITEDDRPEHDGLRIDMAINARFIMNNDLSRITPECRSLPYCIWYPAIPKQSTCRELVRRAPSMKPSISMVCILADYSDLWDQIDPDPDTNLMEAARECHNPKYLSDLESKVGERGCTDYAFDMFCTSVPRVRMFEPSQTSVLPDIRGIVPDDDGVPYNGYQVGMAHVELFVTVSDDFKSGNGTDLNRYYDSLAPNTN
ncbi:hypothetical protein P170DRAFT_406883 [Aspergillus steynii IBT 23096]|uniref:Uncharacterized protein n=1 Tax=Aspergillus steynii IBT 23096 TaxID=1392250 RepID=A0A2I2GE71_9EURO|nr:uncharacterized protein P170DRAFT_406883 [Aspergillus steynii IBT 23096]PLB51184.1 hypothetical protein P170DRAFT_406883 [Aspergillus steynii IBT 23096]